jgi:hypothetical protein
MSLVFDCRRIVPSLSGILHVLGVTSGGFESLPKSLKVSGIDQCIGSLALYFGHVSSLLSQ